MFTLLDWIVLVAFFGVSLLVGLWVSRPSRENKNFKDYISYVKQHNIYTITSTNGQLIDKNIALNIIKSGLDRIIISIDGTTQEVYEKYRKGGLLSKSIEAIKFLKEAKKELNSKTPCMPM